MRVASLKDAKPTMTLEDLEVAREQLLTAQAEMQPNRLIKEMSTREILKGIDAGVHVLRAGLFHSWSRASLERLLTVIRSLDDAVKLGVIIQIIVAERKEGRGAGKSSDRLLVKNLDALHERIIEPQDILSRLTSTWNLSCPVEILDHSCRPRDKRTIGNHPLHPTD